MATNKDKKPHPNVTAKKPPQNIEAEQATLGSVMLDSVAALYVLPDLKESDFYITAHQHIFTAMRALFTRNQPVDIVTVMQELDRQGKTADAGGLEYLTRLTGVIPTAANYRHYSDIVKENGLRRRLISICDIVAEEAYSGENENILNFAESKIFGLGEESGRKELRHISEAVNLAYAQMENIARDKAAYRGVPSGFNLLDGYLNGFQKGDLVILGARPGHGKTSLAMNFVTNAALASVETSLGTKTNLTCAVFSLEMPAEQLAKRMLCSVAKVSMTRASKGDLSDAEWARLNLKRPLIDSIQIFTDDKSGNTPAEIISKCRRLKREKRLDLVMIDYLQLMSVGKKVESRQQEISEITRNLKIAAKELNVPIILLSQLSRKTEERKDKQPQVSDLRESGAIEQDADIILFIYNPSEAENSGNNLPNDVYKLIIAKHRNGETGVIDVKWRGEYVSFENVDQATAISGGSQGSAGALNGGLTGGAGSMGVASVGGSAKLALADDANSDDIVPF